MKKNRYDRINDKILNRIERVSARMTREFKGANPFDKEPVSKEEILYYYNQLTPEKMNELIQTHGRDTVNQMIAEMEGLKRRKG